MTETRDLEGERPALRGLSLRRKRPGPMSGCPTKGQLLDARPGVAQNRSRTGPAGTAAAPATRTCRLRIFPQRMRPPPLRSSPWPWRWPPRAWGPGGRKITSARPGPPEGRRDVPGRRRPRRPRPRHEGAGRRGRLHRHHLQGGRAQARARAPKDISSRSRSAASRGSATDSVARGQRQGLEPGHAGGDFIALALGGPAR